jgi:hypothetical protein
MTEQHKAAAAEIVELVGALYCGRLPARHGQLLRVLIRGGMNSALVEFEDGFRCVTSRNYFRKIK